MRIANCQNKWRMSKMQNSQLELIKLTKVLQQEKIVYDKLVSEYLEKRQTAFSLADYEYFNKQFDKQLQIIKKLNARLKKLG